MNKTIKTHYTIDRKYTWVQVDIPNIDSIDMHPKELERCPVCNNREQQMFFSENIPHLFCVHCQMFYRVVAEDFE